MNDNNSNNKIGDKGRGEEVNDNNNKIVITVKTCT